MADRVGDAPKLAQVDTAAAAADLVELRFYYVGNNGDIDFMGCLQRMGALPPTVRGQVSTGARHTCRLAPGLYVAVVGGGEIKDLAHLSTSLAQHMRNAEMEKVEVGTWEATEEAEMEEGEVGNREATAEAEREVEVGNRESMDEAKEEEATKEDKNERNKEEKEEEEVPMVMEDCNQKEKGEKLLAEVRILSGAAHASVVLFELKRKFIVKDIKWDSASVSKIERGSWILTRAYRLLRLDNNSEKQLVSLINRKERKHYVKASRLSNDCWSRAVYKGILFCSIESHALLSFMDHLLIKEEIGSSSTCTVHLCSLETDPSSQFALKKMAINEYEEIREVRIMSCLADSAIPEFYQAWVQIESDGSRFGLQSEIFVMILMEVCGRDLKDLLFDRNLELTIEDRWGLFQKMATCIKYLHGSGIIHRDLKPNNFFTGADGAIKVGDFGHSCWTLDCERGSRHLGTPMYAAPELRNGLTTEKVDIYSLGACYVEIFLVDPGKPMAAFEALYDLRLRDYDSDRLASLDGDFLKKLTDLDPSARPTIDEVMESMGQMAGGFV